MHGSLTNSRNYNNDKVESKGKSKGERGKGPHMLKSDRGLRISKGKFSWVVVGGMKRPPRKVLSTFSMELLPKYDGID